MFVTITGTRDAGEREHRRDRRRHGVAAQHAAVRESPFASAVRMNSSCRTSRIELFIIRSQTAASGSPSTIHGTISDAEPAQRALARTART